MANMDGEGRLKVKSPHKRSKTLFAEEAEGRTFHSMPTIVGDCQTVGTLAMK
jgi:hypothetical protein